MDHGEQRSELYQSTLAAQHSLLAYVSSSERPTSSCESHEWKLTLHRTTWPHQRQWTHKGSLTAAKKTRTKKARSEFAFRNCRLANRLEKYVEFSRPYGLKKRLINLMWEFVNKRFCDKNVCTWQTFCDCRVCRNKWTLFQQLTTGHKSALQQTRCESPTTTTNMQIEKKFPDDKLLAQIVCNLTDLGAKKFSSLIRNWIIQKNSDNITRCVHFWVNQVQSVFKSAKK